MVKFVAMSEDLVKVRALINVGQLGLSFGQEGEFPLDQVQPLLDRGRVELVDPPKPKRRSRRAAPEAAAEEQAVEPGDEPGDEPEPSAG